MVAMPNDACGSWATVVINNGFIHHVMITMNRWWITMREHDQLWERRTASKAMATTILRGSNQLWLKENTGTWLWGMVTLLVNMHTDACQCSFHRAWSFNRWPVPWQCKSIGTKTVRNAGANFRGNCAVEELEVAQGRRTSTEPAPFAFADISLWLQQPIWPLVKAC